MAVPVQAMVGSSGVDICSSCDLGGCFGVGPVCSHGASSCGGRGRGGAGPHRGLELAMAQGIVFACSKPEKRDKDEAGGYSGNLFQKLTPKEMGSP